MATATGEFVTALRAALGQDNGPGSVQEILTNGIRQTIATYVQELEFVDIFGKHMTTIYNSPEFQAPIVDMVNRRAQEAIDSIPMNQQITDAIAQRIALKIDAIFANADAQVTAMLRSGEEKIGARFKEFGNMADVQYNNLQDLKAKTLQISADLAAVNTKLDTAGPQIDTFHEDFKKALGELQEKVDEAQRNTQRDKDIISREFEQSKANLISLASSIGTRVTGDTGSSTSRGLINPKTTENHTMPENITRADFCFWIENLYLHLENFKEWKGVTHFLKELRKEKEDLDDISIRNCLINAENNSSHEFNKGLFDEKIKDKELYSYLYPKLNTRQKALIIDTKSGFETYRRIVREDDPIGDNTAYALEYEFQDYAFTKAKTLAETRTIISILDTKIAKFREKTGRELDEYLKSRVIRAVLDVETFKDLGRASDVGNKYKEIKAFVEKCHFNDMSREYTRPGARRGKDDMDLSNLNDHDA